MIIFFSTLLISALFVLTVLYWLFFTPLFDKLENGGKKKRDKQAEVLEKVKFHEHTFENYFESLKPNYVGWSNDALANEATEFLSGHFHWVVRLFEIGEFPVSN